MKDHSLIDERSLAFDRLLRARVEADPHLVDKARENVERWLLTCAPGVRSVLLEWRQILSGPRDQLLTLMTSTDEHATRLRQSSPFAGLLSRAERTAILREFQHHDSSAT